LGPAALITSTKHGIAAASGGAIRKARGTQVPSGKKGGWHDGACTFSGREAVRRSAGYQRKPKMHIT